MTKKADDYAVRLALYEKLVAAHPQIEISTHLDPATSFGMRLPEAERVIRHEKRGRSSREEAITGRIESFSDIVIGFSLAQTALNLVIPQHAITFITRPLGIGAFLVTFFVVAQFWWRHSTIFRDYFKPADGGVAARIYAGIFAVTFGALALLSGLGTFYNWERLDGALRASGVERTIKRGCTVIGAAVGTTYASNHVASLTVRVEQHENVRMLALPDQIIVGLLLGIVVGSIVAAVVGRRMRTSFN